MQGHPHKQKLAKWPFISCKDNFSGQKLNLLAHLWSTNLLLILPDFPESANKVCPLEKTPT